MRSGLFATTRCASSLDGLRLADSIPDGRTMKSCPSIQPRTRMSARQYSSATGLRSGKKAIRLGALLVFCARTPSGHIAAAPPIRPTNSRRCMSTPKFRRRHTAARNEYIDRADTVIGGSTAMRCGCLRWVKTGKAQGEHMFSAFPLKADIAGFQAQTERLPCGDPSRRLGRAMLVPLFSEGEGPWKIAQIP